jgi:hypothetical protein
MSNRGLREKLPGAEEGTIVFAKARGYLEFFGLLFLTSLM